MMILLKNILLWSRRSGGFYLVVPIVFALLFPGGSLAYELADVQIHGFGSQGFLLTKGNNYLASGTQGKGSLSFNEFAINASWQATDSLRIAGQLMSRKLGGDGDNRLYLDWGVFDYRANEYLGLQLGKFKIPVGLYNQTRNIDLARVNVFLPQSIYTETYRPFFSSSTGGLIYGTIPIWHSGSVEYEFFYGKADEDNNSCLVRSLQLILNGANMNMEANQVYGGALRYNAPLPGLRLGYSLARGDADFDYSNPYGHSAIKGGAEPGHVISLEYSIGDFIFSSEWMLTEQSSTYWTATPMGTQVSTTESTAEGYYIKGSYLLTDWLEVAAQYEVYYRDRDDKDGEHINSTFLASPFGAWQKSMSLAARFDITDYWLVKVEGQYIDGTALLSPVYNEERDYKRYWNLLALKTTLFF